MVVVKAGSAAGHIKKLKKTDPQNKALWQELSGDQSVNRRSDSAFLQHLSGFVRVTDGNMSSQ